jgi:hypothetical protein
MPGLVTLAGPSFDARMDAGALCGLSRRGLPLFPLQKLQTYIACGTGLQLFTAESAASFEEGSARGLRAVLTQTGGSVVIDYAFADSCPALIVDVHASYPTLGADCRAVVPFGIVVELERANSTVAIQCLGDDGERQERRIVADVQPGVPQTVAGTAFVVVAGASRLCLSFPERQGLSRRPLQFMVLPERRPHRLLLNPLGTFFATETSAYSAAQEQLTLILSPEPDPPRLPRAVVRACLAHRILRRPFASPGSR